MSEHITHIAVYEDCARIVLNTDSFCKAFRECVSAQYDSGLLTSGSRGNHLFAVPILEKYRDKWEEVRGDQEATQQIAGAIGWITHRAADHQMKPTWRAMEAEDPHFPDTEMQIYHDSVTFREVYSGGRVSTESPYELLKKHTLEENLATHPATPYLDPEKVEEILSFLYQKQFVELHNFHKTTTDVGEWMNQFVEYHQEFTEDLRTYIEAFNNPDPAKMETYVHGINFYDPGDDLISWVRAIQQGEGADETGLPVALEMADNQSHYARALKKGYGYLSAASDYFTHRIEKDALYDALEIFGDNRL